MESMFQWPAFIFVCTLLCSCVWNEPESNPEFLTLDDSEYPYAGIPRLVIETEDFAQIRDRETKIPAKLQIYGIDSPESAVLDLTIKGRGNSSFTGMPKPSYKIEFEKKQEMFGMPKDRDWALIANSADKTLLKNFITYKLAGWLGDEYTPRCTFVELYLNHQYQGVYLLTETVKAGKNRVNIPKEEFSYLIEFSSTEHPNEIHVITKRGNNFHVKYPKDPSDSTLNVLRQQLINWEFFLYHEANPDDTTYRERIDIDDYIRYYWIQELSKNFDGAFRRSIFITWERGMPMKLGPVWDFDVAYGNWEVDSLRTPTDWYVRSSEWNKQLLQITEVKEKTDSYWNANEPFFRTLPDSIRKYAKELSPAAKNEFKRWPVLENTENWTYKEAYGSYGEAIDSLNSWIKQRIEWISHHL
ncbi:MAG: CotH kinase family protein [Fibrobacter sp.]|uniref:CotH kinase family protein n=1 Tax=Fibrobacter sp. TaxID=35828 RepID=UPI0025C4707D|nr:CotH kinase family protein [Fibrobacter sp.]MBR2058746.1 CotH kinase family protein [Fibrobacter sp.]MBR3852521.1 CotH kinase family protein [Fibrobacter sp.]MBR4007661.1 CotH kinase family protein [Fibrobacter sp.]